MSIEKIVVIGGGSSYTPELLSGFIQRAHQLPVKEIVLVDIESGRHKLEVIHQMGLRMFAANKLNTQLTTSYDLTSALEGAHYVLNQIRVGGLEGRALDESIPNQFGLIGQETTGAGGCFLALRAIPVVVDIAKKMETLCPNAILINFTNPAGIVTEAVSKASSIKCIGLCNVPINMKYELAELLERPVETLSFDYIGLNHLSFISRVYDQDQDYTAELLARPNDIQEIVANVPAVENPEAVIKAIGLIPSPYLTYFYYENQQIEKELEGIREGRGTRATEVMAAEAELFEIYKDLDLSEKPDALKKRGGSLYSEAALQLIASIHLNEATIQTVNITNGSTIEALPADAVIEVNCLIDKNGATPIGPLTIPPQVKGLLQQVKNYEQLTVAAALEGNLTLAKQAFISHPLIHDADKALKLFDALLEAHRAHLNHFYERGSQ